MLALLLVTLVSLAFVTLAATGICSAYIERRATSYVSGTFTFCHKRRYASAGLERHLWRTSHWRTGGCRVRPLIKPVTVVRLTVHLPVVSDCTELRSSRRLYITSTVLLKTAG